MQMTNVNNNAAAAAAESSQVRDVSHMHDFDDDLGYLFWFDSVFVFV